MSSNFTTSEGLSAASEKIEPLKSTYFRYLGINFKVQAVQIYESQMRTYRFLDHIWTIARLRGMQFNMEYVVAFGVVRWVT